jgi:hypothetical protein
MKLENQVVSLEYAKKLKELGVRQESLFWWVEYTDGHGEKEHWAIENNHVGYKQYISAFTVAELGEMLPMIYIPVRDGKKGWLWSGNGEKNYEKTEADARAKMLICLLEKNLLQAKELLK